MTFCSRPYWLVYVFSFFFFSSRRRHTRFDCDWSSDVCSSDLVADDDRLPGVEPSQSAERAAAGEQPVEQQPDDDGGGGERGVDDGEGGAAAPKWPPREDEPGREPRGARHAGRDYPDPEGQEGDPVHRAIA